MIYMTSVITMQSRRATLGGRPVTALLRAGPHPATAMTRRVPGRTRRSRAGPRARPSVQFLPDELRFDVILAQPEVPTWYIYHKIQYLPMEKVYSVCYRFRSYSRNTSADRCLHLPRQRRPERTGDPSGHNCHRWTATGQPHPSGDEYPCRDIISHIGSGLPERYKGTVSFRLRGIFPDHRQGVTPHL